MKGSNNAFLCRFNDRWQICFLPIQVGRLTTAWEDTAPEYNMQSPADIEAVQEANMTRPQRRLARVQELQANVCKPSQGAAVPAHAPQLLRSWMHLARQGTHRACAASHCPTTRLRLLPHFRARTLGHSLPEGQQE